ncbi:hypothetical protein G7Y89_g13972 [Cudoniella acicularis]|uniref:Major facilitator superfamily (MFS) profile domain-containing protein n=1 Tax=Cudoniella acicularis TaxID=354080 RepID=A0A8H4R8S0_9HELO|nr:hypothetical protein G7Y89_g13972 [Cudoniella acicularis]
MFLNLQEATTLRFIHFLADVQAGNVIIAFVDQGSTGDFMGNTKIYLKAWGNGTGRHLSPISRNFEPGDRQRIGPCVLDLVWGMCPDTIHVFNAEDDSLNISTDNVFANKECYIICDMFLIECFKDRPYIAGWPYQRFYAKVPIRTTTGILIGSYCVTDTKPHARLDAMGLRKLTEIASAITHHLELVQAQKSLEGSREMVKGLGLFAEGQRSLRKWWTDIFTILNKNFDELLVERSRNSSGLNRALSAASATLETILNKPRIARNLSTSSSESSDGDFNSTAAIISHTTRRFSQDSPKSSNRTNMTLQSDSGQYHIGNVRNSDSGSKKSEASFEQEMMAYGAIKALFSRASHLVQETSDLNGIIFVNASLHDITLSQCFGSCIMAEKSKMDSMATERSKADFISSVSHELRSPLHGILATLEAMEEIPRSIEEDEMIRTAATCGDVLLNTRTIFILKKPPPEDPSVQSTGSNPIRDIGVWCKGMSLCLVGFDYPPEMEETSTGILGIHSRRMLALKSAIATFAIDWFGMKVVTAPSIVEAAGHILVGVQSQINLPERISRKEPPRPAKMRRFSIYLNQSEASSDSPSLEPRNTNSTSLSRDPEMTKNNKMTSTAGPARPTSPSNSFYALSDDEEGEYNTITHTSSGRGVYIHPTPSAKDNIPGYIALLQQKPAPDSRPTSSSSTSAKSKASSSLLLAWLPESSLGDALNTYVKVDLAEGNSPPRQSYLVPPPPTTTTHSGSIGHYAFAIPVSAIYSLLVRPPSLGWWFGSVIINSRAGDSFPALFFHDSECQSTILQKKKRAREHFDPFGANGEMFWGGDEVLRWLRRYVEIERSGAEPNIYLVEPSAEDKAAFGKVITSAPLRRPSSSGMRIGAAAGAATASSSRDAGMDPVTKFVKEAGWNLMEKFSKVTTFTRRTADSVIDNPKMPPQVRRLLKNPEVQTIQEEFDSARIYLARWAMGIAEQSERDRNNRIWTARDVLEMEETGVGEFELLDTEVAGLSLKEQRKTVSMKEWNTYFDQRTGRLQITVDEVKERIFHGGLDPEDGVRKEAWLFLLGVYEWDSTADERRAEAASLRDAYVKLKGAWWDRLIDLGGEGEEGEWWREQKGRIEKDVHRTDRTIPLFAGEDTPHPDPSSPFADAGTNVHLEQMKDMLLTYNEYNRDLGYVQGMSDLLAPIYAVMQDDAIAFWGFQHFMNRMERNFLRDQSDILHLWEVLWTDYLSSNFHLFFALAILEKHRDVIMEHLKHFDEVLKYVNELSTTIDLESTLVRAESLFRRFQRTVEAIDKKSNFPAPKLRQRTIGQKPSDASPKSPTASGTGVATAGTSGTDTVTAGSTNSSTPPRALAQGKDKGKSPATVENSRRSDDARRSTELEEQRPKIISPELRELLSRKVEVLSRKVINITASDTMEDSIMDALQVLSHEKMSKNMPISPNKDTLPTIIPSTVLSSSKSSPSQLENGQPPQNPAILSFHDQQANVLPHHKLMIVFPVIALVQFTAYLDQTSVSAALPSIGRGLNLGTSISWVATSYLLATTVVQLVYGRLSDIFGRKGLLLMSLGVLALGNLATGFSQNGTMIFVFRAIGGLGGGAITALVQIIASDITTLKQRGKYNGFIGAAVSMGSGLGPLIGGVVSSKLSWRWTFWYDVPWLLFIMVLVTVLLPKSQVSGSSTLAKLKLIDWAGVLVSVAATVLLLIPLSEGGAIFSWNSAIVISMLVIGGVVVGAFLLVEHKFATLPVMPPGNLTFKVKV